MPGDGNVLLVLEGCPLREECVRLAFELAKRLACGVDALLLTGGNGPAEGDVDDVLAGMAGAATEEGIGMTRASRTGDPGSELLKHLATRGTARVLVWAGDDAALRSSRHARKGNHWFIRVREQVHCPVVTATSRVASRQSPNESAWHEGTSRKT